MPQQISTFGMNPSPIKSVNVNLTDWGNFSTAPIELQYDPYTQVLNINVHRALQDAVVNQTLINNAACHFTSVQTDVSIMKSDVTAIKHFMNEWKDLIDAYHKNEAVRKTVDQAKLVAGIVKDDTDGDKL